MIIVLKPRISRKDEAAVLKEIKRLGYRPHIMRGVAHTVIGAIGDERTHRTLEVLASWPQVQSVMPVQKRFKLVSREAHQTNSTINVRGVVIGGKKFQVMAGPCSVESEKQLLTTAHAVQRSGATILRGGAFKPRTSPYEFQGLGEKGLKLLAKARKETGLAIITELLSEPQAELVAEYADILQIGTRNAQNFQLLIAAARTGKPILLKRGLSMKIEDQGAGRADLVVAMCKGAVAMGADALLVEVHPNPAEAWSDGAQQLTLDAFARLMLEIRPFIAAAGRE